MNFAGATASASAQQEQNQAISEKDLRNQPSLGFTSAIHEAFDRAEDQVRPTPNPAAISTIGHSTSGVTITMNPIINNGREESSVQPNRMNVSVMREFLESGEKFSWPPELGDLSGNHCDLKSQVIPLRWKRKIQDRESSIDQYEANPEYHFGFRKSFVVKTRRDLSTRKNHERTAIEVKNMKDLRHPHVIALLGTFTLHKRSNILIFPAPCCDLQQYMKQTSRDLQDIGDQSHQTHALSQVVTSSNGRGSPESSTGSTSSQGSRYGSEAMGYQKRLKNHPRKKSDVWPLNTSLQFKMASLRGYFVCLSQALRYIHESGVLHKDIKPTNIWIDESGSVILTNFEISQRLPKDIPYDASGQWSFTRRYASPEVMKHGNIPTGYPSDVFSLGCVFLEIMTLLLGHESTDFIATVEDDTYLNNAYYCNLDKVSSWIGILRESHWSENVSLRLTQNRRNEGQGSSPTAESSTIDALIPIQRMLAENPQARPSSRGLWADFQSVNSTICPDCDPRHPQAWGSEQVAGLDSHDNESEVSSIASINAPSLFTGSTLSSTNSFMEVQGTAEEFAKVLLTDEILGPLYVVALHRIDIERLERNLARLLTSYAKDLRVEATTDLERIAVKFARRYAQSVASHLCTSLNPSRNARYMEMQQLSAHVVQNEESIEHFLQQVVESGTRDHFSHTTQAFHDTTLETKNEHSDDSESDAENCQNLSNLSNVKAFMTESKAFAGLRENFRTFVTPVSGDRDQKRVDQELAEKHPESVPTSDDSKEISENREQEDVDQELVGDHLQSAPNSDDSKETTDTNSTTTDSSETQTSHIDIAFEESIKAPWYNRSCDILKEVVSLTAEFLKVREKPLRYGMERVRWTCVRLLTGMTTRPDH